MERFWPTLERRAADVPVLEWVERYNNIEQIGLPRNPRITDTMVPLTPNQAYATLTHWTDGTTGHWRVNTRVRPFIPEKAVKQCTKGGIVPRKRKVFAQRQRGPRRRSAATSLA
jgi:hypothetical protein